MRIDKSHVCGSQYSSLHRSTWSHALTPINPSLAIALHTGQRVTRKVPLVSRVRCYVPCLSRGGNDDPQQKSIRHFAWIKPTNCKHKWVKSYRVYSFFRSLASGFPHATLNFYVRPVSRYRKTLFLSPRIVTPGDTLKDL